MRAMDNKNELLPLVDPSGHVIGSVTRAEAHGGGKPLHPVVHLHVLNGNGELFLQKRPEWKDIQPGKWDTACGGHVAFGETIEEALHREVMEELGISDYTPHFICRYVFESDRERELVHVFATVYDGTIKTSGEELDGGRFWTKVQLCENEGQETLTPNFVDEYRRIRQELERLANTIKTPTSR